MRCLLPPSLSQPRASHAAQVQSRVKKLEKINRVDPPKRRQTMLFDFPHAPRSMALAANFRRPAFCWGGPRSCLHLFARRIVERRQGNLCRIGFGRHDQFVAP